jgi:hypothetical protein
MKTDKRTDYVTRDAILKLLSDDEVSAVSAAEASPKLIAGDQYIDLEDLAQGVRTAGTSEVSMGNVLPKKAVQVATWSKILQQIKSPQAQP